MYINIRDKNISINMKVTIMKEKETIIKHNTYLLLRITIFFLTA